MCKKFENDRADKLCDSIVLDTLDQELTDFYRNPPLERKAMLR